MAPFVEDHYFIVSPGSSITSVQFGVGESFAPPTIEIPTKVYSTDHPGVFASSGDQSRAIYPIVDGKIADIKAFHFFLKLIYKSILQKHPNVSNIPFLLVSSTNWSKTDIELITQYVFESMELNTFAIIPEALSALFAYGSQPNAIVVEIGKNKTEIVPILDYAVVKYAAKVIPYGGETINEQLLKLLPNLNPKQIESLKKSDIYEVLSDEDKKRSFFGFDGLNQEPEKEFDVATIVASGKTEEFINKKKKNTDQTPNNQLESNIFYDENNNEITIGRERFKGSEVLINEIVKGIHESLLRIDDLSKRQECYDHIIIDGKTNKISGLQDAINTKLIEDYLVGKEYQQTAAQAAFQTTSANTVHFEQVPRSIKFEKMPEYFTEWKKYGFHDVAFLGAEVVAKYIFGGHNDQLFVTRNSYNEKGPLAIWDLSF